ncbi:MAG: hypothetical protein U0L18_11500 [Acutalibacteraceae bacterium]|nr:hypothetical protein [Acutalibacteraceae bacterium]
MNKKILYSSVGGTDPISNFRDGSLLHICRSYKPDKVVLLISAEMCNYHHNDNRYLYCIEKLGELLNHHFETEVIEQPDLRKVNDIDTVYPIIKENISRITSTMDESDVLYVNIASGTPAIKYSQQFIAGINKYKIIPVMVATPMRSINPHREDINNYDVEKMWQLNDDNSPDKYENRCSEAKSMVMMSDFYKIPLTELVCGYNYSSALALLDSMPQLCTNNLKKLLDGANDRLQLNTDKAIAEFADTSFKFPYNDDKKEIFEYALLLDIKLKKNEIADFVRAVTPLAGNLYTLTLKNYCGVNLNDYTTNNNGCIKWSEPKLKGTQPDTVLHNAYNGCFDYGVVYDVQLQKLLTAMVQDEKALMYIKNIAEFEKNIKKHTHNSIASVTGEKLRAYTGFTADEIYSNIKGLLELNGISATEWDSYDKMNTAILNEVNSI